MKSDSISVAMTDAPIIRTTNSAATDKIAHLRSISGALKKGNSAAHILQAIDLIADILQDLNEVPLYR